MADLKKEEKKEKKIEIFGPGLGRTRFGEGEKRLEKTRKPKNRPAGRFPA